MPFQVKPEGRSAWQERELEWVKEKDWDLGLELHLAWVLGTNRLMFLRHRRHNRLTLQDYTKQLSQQLF